MGKKHLDIVANSDVCLFHTRFATHGAKTAENAHPFQFGNIIGSHNGVLSNHFELNKKFERTFEVDSMHLIQHFAEGRESFADIEGYGATQHLDITEPDRVKLTKFNSGSLDVIEVHGIGIFWSSLFLDLKAALSLVGYYGNPAISTKLIKFDDGDIIDAVVTDDKATCYMGGSIDVAKKSYGGWQNHYRPSTYPAAKGSDSKETEGTSNIHSWGSDGGYDWDDDYRSGYQGRSATTTDTKDEPTTPTVEEYMNALCVACEGTGRSTNNESCIPCKGSGRKDGKEEKCCTTLIPIERLDHKRGAGETASDEGEIGLDDSEFSSGITDGEIDPEAAGSGFLNLTQDEVRFLALELGMPDEVIYETSLVEVEELREQYGSKMNEKFFQYGESSEFECDEDDNVKEAVEERLAFLDELKPLREQAIETDIYV